RLVLALLALVVLAPSQQAKAADVICYNCPPEWADWASMLKAIKTDLGYDIPHDNKNSGQALAEILAEKSNPVGDIGYFGDGIALLGENLGQRLAGVLVVVRDVIAEKSNPVGDIGYFGVTFGMKAKAQDALEAYRPANWD